MQQDAAVIPAPEQRLPEIQETASVNEVFRQLAGQSVGTFILMGKGRPPKTVQGVALANALLALDLSSRSGEQRIGDVVYQQALGVAVVRGEAPTRSNPPVFICSNPDPHENLEWNDGYCSECPFPLKSAR